MRDPRDTLNEICYVKNYNPSQAADYYNFRLSRFASLASVARDSILLTYEDLISGNARGLIEEYLWLKDPVIIEKPANMNLDNIIPLNLLKKSELVFEKTLYKLKKLGLRFV